jgi:hypothetical protein
MDRLAIVSLVVILQGALLGSAPSTLRGAELQAAAEAKWLEDIVALEARDQSESHPADSILFVGSSSIRKWKSIVADMVPYHPIQRGYGGSKFSDVAVFAERLLTPHRFRALVLFVGNDVKGVKEDATPEQVAGWFGHVVDVAREAQPEAAIFCLEIFPTLSRWEAWPQIREVNRALAQACASRRGVYFVRQANAYLGVDGKPQADLFLHDRLHLNDLGYRIWSGIIKSHLDEVLDPECSGPQR